MLTYLEEKREGLSRGLMVPGDEAYFVNIREDPTGEGVRVRLDNRRGEEIFSDKLRFQPSYDDRGRPSLSGEEASAPSGQEEFKAYCDFLREYYAETDLAQINGTLEVS